MKFVKRLLVTLVVFVVLGALAEGALRVVLPSVIEGGVRIPLRVAQQDAVDVRLSGSTALNALTGKIKDVTIEAENVPFSDEVHAQTRMRIGAMPIIPIIGSLRDGSATFTFAPDQLDGVVSLVSGGLADHGEMRDGQLVTSGTLTDAQFDLPYAPAFELPYEATVELSASDGAIDVTPTRVDVDGTGAVADFLTENLGSPHPVCVADVLPKGMTVTAIAVDDDGTTTMEVALDAGLISDPDMRFRGSCDADAADGDETE